MNWSCLTDRTRTTCRSVGESNSFVHVSDLISQVLSTTLHAQVHTRLHLQSQNQSRFLRSKSLILLHSHFLEPTDILTCPRLPTVECSILEFMHSVTMTPVGAGYFIHTAFAHFALAKPSDILPLLYEGHSLTLLIHYILGHGFSHLPRTVHLEQKWFPRSAVLSFCLIYIDKLFRIPWRNFHYSSNIGICLQFHSVIHSLWIHSYSPSHPYGYHVPVYGLLIFIFSTVLSLSVYFPTSRFFNRAMFCTPLANSSVP